MSDSDDDYVNLRSRRIRKPRNLRTEEILTQQTSTPVQSPSSRLHALRKSIQQATQFYKELSDRVDSNTSDINLTTLFPDIEEQPITFMMDQTPPPFYNKEMADLMATNIPKFDLSSNTNPALGLRSFIRSCENVLSLFRNDDEQSKAEFFKLIKFRLGYDVQERITVEKFENIQELEAHLRSICHLKLNKGKLLNEIRHERQHNNEDVSHFVERLRKLIAQGRSEYPNDQEFEREAVHTLKNSVKNEFISIKLMDSTTNRFEDLAEIAINRDSDLHQRSYKISKTESPSSQHLIEELLQKIKNLEAKQTANIQHIRQEPRFKTHPNQFNNPSRAPRMCNYCKRVGHNINECRTKRRNENNQQNYNYPRKDNYNYNPNPPRFRNSEIPNYSPNRNMNLSRNYQSPNFSQNSNERSFYRNPQRDNSQNYNSRNRYSQDIHPNNMQRNSNPERTAATCLRCNKYGHKSNNCYEVICSICKQLEHSQNQCPQNTAFRRVHLSNCENCDESHHNNQQQRQNAQIQTNQGNE